MEAQNNITMKAKPAFWISSVLGAVFTMATVFLAYQMFTNEVFRNWRGFTTILFFLCLSISAWSSAFLCRRKQHVTGISILLISLLLLILYIPFVVIARALPVALIGLLIITGISIQTLPDKRANRFIILGSLAGITTVLIDLWIPFERLVIIHRPLPLYVLGFTAIGLFLVLLFQYNRLRLRTKMLVTFVSIPTIVVMLVAGIFFFTFFNNLNAEIMQNSATYEAISQTLAFSLSVVAIALMLMPLLALAISQTLTNPMNNLINAAEEISQGNLDVEIQLENKDEFGVLAQTFNAMAERLRDSFTILEVAVQERTKDLAFAAEIGQKVSQLRDLDELATTAVSLIRDRFDLYHVQLYLADDSQSTLTLLASVGEAGVQLLAAGDALPLDATSLIGRAASQKQPILVGDTAVSDNFMAHPLLPDIRSETAVPLLAGRTVVGVLDLQSDQPHTFTEENLPAFVTLAGQLAIAVENSTLFAEQKQAENRLIEEQNRTLLILESIGTPLVIARASDGLIIYVNEPLSRIVNIPREELVGQITPDYFQNPADRQIFVEGLRQKGEMSNFEVTLKNRDGTLFRALLTGKIAQFQDDLVTITSFIDITERQKIAAAIEENQALLRTLVDSTPDWIFIKNREHRYQMVNQAYADSWRLEPEAFIGKNDLEIGFPEEIVNGNPEKGIRGLWADDQEIMEAGEIKIIDEETAVVDGEPRTFNTIKVPLKNPAGEVTGIVSFVHDITTLKQAEAVMAKQTADLQTVAELSTAVSTTLDTKQLLQTVVNHTKERFNLYHAHIYLLNASQNFLELAAGAGEVGQQMVAAGHNIPFHQPNSLVAQAARSGQGVIVNQVTADPAFLPNPLLPQTQSEMAVPMMVGNKVIGVLDVQSEEVGHFTITDINIQTTLAAQIAAALENARAYEQARQSAFIMENSTNIIATISVDQKIQYLNNAGLRQLGYKSLADVQGKNISILFPKEAAESHRTVTMLAVLEHGLWRGDSMLVTTSGERFPVEQVATMIRDESGVPQMIIFNMTDISERKAAEAAQQALTAELAEQLERVNALQRSLTREGWQAFMTTSKRPFQGFAFNKSGVKTLTDAELNSENGKGKRPLHTGGNEFINPVKIHGATIGQIGARHPDGKPLSEAQQELLTSLTNQVAEALERARLSEQTQIALTETEQREQELAVLNEMAQSLTAQTTVDDVLDVIHDYTTRLMASDEFYIAFYNAAENEIIFPYGILDGRVVRNYGRRKGGKGLTEHVLAQGHPLLIPNNIDQYLHELGIEAVGKSAESWMGCPMQYGEQVVGLISLQSYTTPNAYTELDLRLLTAIANQAAIAIENARLIEATGKRARQEQLLREVSTKVSAAVDAESVLHVATREIGRALGLETFVYLKSPKE